MNAFLCMKCYMYIYCTAEVSTFESFLIDLLVFRLVGWDFSFLSMVIDFGSYSKFLAAVQCADHAYYSYYTLSVSDGFVSDFFFHLLEKKSNNKNSSLTFSQCKQGHYCISVIGARDKIQRSPLSSPMPLYLSMPVERGKEKKTPQSHYKTWLFFSQSPAHIWAEPSTG